MESRGINILACLNQINKVYFEIVKWFDIICNLISKGFHRIHSLQKNTFLWRKRYVIPWSNWRVFPLFFPKNISIYWFLHFYALHSNLLKRINNLLFHNIKPNRLTLGYYGINYKSNHLPSQNILISNTWAKYWRVIV